MEKICKEGAKNLNGLQANNKRIKDKENDIKHSSKKTDESDIYMRIEKLEMMESLTFSGPLPHPSHFAEYEKILSGSADRILKMVEEQSAHRRKMEERYLKDSVYTSRMGVIFAFLLGLSCIVGGVILGINHKGWLAGVISLTGLGSIVGSFIYGTKVSNNDIDSEQK